jgi:redox-sensitive bicupin YhaK (pirin superfamily)
MTIIDTGTVVAEEITGRVTTPVRLYRSIPDRTPHASFGIEQPDHRTVAVHVTGDLAERTREAVHRGDQVVILDGQAHQHPQARVLDVDAAALTVTIRAH